MKPRDPLFPKGFEETRDMKQQYREENLQKPHKITEQRRSDGLPKKILKSIRILTKLFWGIKVKTSTYRFY